MNELNEVGDEVEGREMRDEKGKEKEKGAFNRDWQLETGDWQPETGNQQPTPVTEAFLK